MRSIEHDCRPTNRPNDSADACRSKELFLCLGQRVVELSEIAGDEVRPERLANKAAIVVVRLDNVRGRRILTVTIDHAAPWNDETVAVMEYALSKDEFIFLW